MATDVISSLAGSLDAELQKARENLRGVDSSIKKLFGKDASEIGGGFPKFGNRRNFNNPEYQNEDENIRNNSFGSNSFNNRGGGGPRGDIRIERIERDRRRDDYDRNRDEDEPGQKRRRIDVGAPRPSPIVIGPRLRPRFDQEDDLEHSHSHSHPHITGPGNIGRRLQSRIVSSAKEKSREEVLAEQSKDRKGRDRNRRMFGALLGTLHRFKQEESKLKPKEEKRAQIEAKLDEAAKREREEVKKERLTLIRERKLQITEIKRLEIKRRRIAELEQWENKTSYLTNFIRTEAKPHIFYMPKVLNPITECRLDESKQFVTEMIASKRKLVLEDLEEFEQRSRRYWENRVDGDKDKTNKGEVDPMDEDMEFELKEIMKNEDVDVADAEVEDFTITVFETRKEAEAEAEPSEDPYQEPVLAHPSAPENEKEEKPIISDILIPIKQEKLDLVQKDNGEEESNESPENGDEGEGEAEADEEPEDNQPDQDQDDDEAKENLTA